MDSTCDRYQPAGSNSKGHRRGLRHVRQDDGGHGNEERPSSGKTTAAAIVAIAIFAPEFANLTTDDNLAWTIYLTLNEAAKGLLCLVLAMSLREFRTIGMAGTIWFVTQAMDEMTNGNLFTEHTYEYPLLALLALAAYLIERK